MRLPHLSFPTVIPASSIMPLESIPRDEQTRTILQPGSTVYRSTWRATLRDLVNSKGYFDGTIDPLQRNEWFGIPSARIYRSEGADGIVRYVATLAVRGWTDAAVACAELFRSVTATPTGSFLPHLVAHEEPGDVDVSAYLSNAELQFTQSTESRAYTVGSNGIVTIEHEAWTQSEHAGSSIVNRGVTTCAAAYMLERAGVRCEVILRLTGENMGGAVYDHRITVKRAGETINLPRMLFWLSHPAAYRCMLFAIRWQANGSHSYYPHGLPPIVKGAIRMSGQERGQGLTEWLAENLKTCGLRLK